MRKSNKTGADAVQENALGHNSEARKKAVADYIKEDMKIVRQIEALNDKRKNNLRKAKEDGLLKTSIRSTTKFCTMSAEQRQAKEETESETKFYREAAKQYGLFDNSEEETTENKDAA